MSTDSKSKLLGWLKKLTTEEKLRHPKSSNSTQSNIKVDGCYCELLTANYRSTLNVSRIYSSIYQNLAKYSKKRIMRNIDSTRLLNDSKGHKHSASAYGLEELQTNPHTSYFSYANQQSDQLKSMKNKSVTVHQSKDELVNRASTILK